MQALAEFVSEIAGSRPDVRSLSVAFARHLVAGETELVREAAKVARARSEPVADTLEAAYAAGAFAALGTLALAWSDILAQRDAAARATQLAQAPHLSGVVARLAGGAALGCGELAAALGTSAPVMSRRLEELRTLGIAEVWAPPGTDARARPHRLTALGASIARTLPPLVQAEKPPVTPPTSNTFGAAIRHILRRITVDVPELYAGHERPLFHRAILAGLAAQALLEQRAFSAEDLLFAQTLNVVCARPAPETTAMAAALHRDWEGTRSGVPAAARMRRCGAVLADTVARPLTNHAHRSEELLTLLGQERHAPWVPLACLVAVEHARVSEPHRARLLERVHHCLTPWLEQEDPLLSLPAAHWLGMAEYLRGRDPTPYWSRAESMTLPAAADDSARTRILRELHVSARFNSRWARVEAGARAHLVEQLTARFGAEAHQALAAVDVARTWTPDEPIVAWSMCQRENVDRLLRELYQQDAAWRRAVDELGDEVRHLSVLTKDEGSNTALHAILGRARRMVMAVSRKRAPTEDVTLADGEQVAADGKGLFTSPLLSAWAAACEATVEEPSAAATEPAAPSPQVVTLAPVAAPTAPAPAAPAENVVLLQNYVQHLPRTRPNWLQQVGSTSREVQCAP